MENSYGEIVISDNIVTDISEYDSYEEATIAAEMFSLQNIRVEEHDGKYKLIACSEARDFNGKHLKVGDKVHCDLGDTWEIVDIEKIPTLMHIKLKLEGHTINMYESVNKDGQYIFNRLSLGKIGGAYIMNLILESIGKFLGTYRKLMYIMLFIGIVIFSFTVAPMIVRNMF